ncbi:MULTISPECIES: hypothetical protein [Rhodopseudomonas]|uniref:Uncharacterized protein n=1 Tax=Rhodopseudomonas palustris TaxID=1076 RepID=A0A0D7ELL1_RHOPL|nr:MULTISPECIES: hypothetical protein [Rhodopseudomonas]KIZ41440.1 hypothetical protein OO17_15155 [Rhodopseudomonas palustris]MDF3810056.1 hypothetical protein [Rhodopseudomonas sp. BAL398]WOK18733.1 hypothetical protein RBJ75_04175 [Rhodopseudomonas sp. BAL398]
MLRSGEMVKGDAGPPMRFLGIDPDGMARCLVVDDDGVIRHCTVYPNNLRAMRDVFRPRTCWRETNSFDLVEIEKEERAAAESRRLQRKSARKAKRSNKIKRGKAPVAA